MEKERDRIQPPVLVVTNRYQTLYRHLGSTTPGWLSEAVGGLGSPPLSQSIDAHREKTG